MRAFCLSFKYALILSYEGYPFGGWQRQPEKAAPLPSIQGLLEDAVHRLTEEECSCVASGRTDAGVNAVGQVVHFRTKKDLSDYSVLRALNTFLPATIRVLDVRRVDSDFHAQRSAIKKQYSYYWIQGKTRPAHHMTSAALLPLEIKPEQIREALKFLEGKHDFKSFQAVGSKPNMSTERSILSANFSEIPFGVPGELIDSNLKLYRLKLVGDGFLKQMVRSIAGTLLWVGEGRLKPSVIEEVLTKPDRQKIGPTAPPEGLWLEKVWYSEDPFART